jgi:hypothetical protein
VSTAARRRGAVDGDVPFATCVATDPVASPDDPSDIESDGSAVRLHEEQ